MQQTTESPAPLDRKSVRYKVYKCLAEIALVVIVLTIAFVLHL
jgi:hypothetical protein